LCIFIIYETKITTIKIIACYALHTFYEIHTEWGRYNSECLTFENDDVPIVSIEEIPKEANEKLEE